MKRNLLLLLLFAMSNLLMAQHEFISTHASEMTTGSVAFKSLGLDSQGNIWIGTVTSKILRHNGDEWITYDNSVLNLDGSVFINKIYEDTDGRVWFMTNGGITYFQNETWTTFTTANGLQSNKANSATSFDGKVYFSSSSGLMIYDGTNWTYDEIPGAYGLDSDVAVDGEGFLWATFKEHATTYRLNGNQWETFDMSNSGICSEDITGAHATSSGDLWFYDRNGDACVYNGTSFTSSSDLPGWGVGMGNNITSIASTSNSPEELWIAADGFGSNGIAHRKDNVNTYYGPAQGVQSNWIQDIVVSGNGAKVYGISVSSLYTGTNSDIASNVLSLAESDLSAYPNPTNDKVYLVDGKQILPEIFQLEIFSADGRLLMTRKQRIDDAIDFSSYAKGWYFMRLSSEKVTLSGMRIFRG